MDYALPDVHEGLQTSWGQAWRLVPGRFGEQLVAGYLDKVSLSFLVDDLRVTARENRAFLGHPVRFLVRDAGIGADP